MLTPLEDGGTAASPEVGAQPLPTSTTSGVVAVHHETLIALKNALMLTASLIGTLGVAVAVRIWIPRYVGPSSFGRLQFGEEFTAAAFFFTTLGVETYIKREVATRPGHASEFFGGLLLVRLFATLVVVGGIAAVLSLMGKPIADWPVVYLFAAGQTAFVLNTTFAACLQSVGHVRELAITNVASKILWGIGIVVGLSLGGGILVVPAALFATEALKAPLLFWAARRHLELRISRLLRPMLAVVAFSFPYYLNQLGYEVYGRLGTSVMSAMAGNTEVGWYGAANQVKTLLLLALPIVNAVILPMSSRIARESTEALNGLMRSAARLALAVTVPLAYVLFLNANTITRILFGPAYDPADASLRALALLVPLSAYCVVSSMHLLQLGRIWLMTGISLLGLAFNAVVNPTLIGYGHDHLGDGGAALGASSAALVTEALVAGLMALALGKARFDGKTWPLMGRLALLGVILAVVHFVTAPIGGARLLLDTLAAVPLAVALRVLPLREIRLYARVLLQQRSQGHMERKQ